MQTGSEIAACRHISSPDSKNRQEIALGRAIVRLSFEQLH